MSDASTTYSSYLLRLWQDGGRCKPVYRASLESAQTGERVGFENLEDLCGFLRVVADPGIDRDLEQGRGRGSIRIGLGPGSLVWEES